MKHARSLLVAALALSCLSSVARADLLNAGDVLCVEFTTSVGTNNTPDALAFGLGAITVNAAMTSRSAALYDGSTLLGVDTNTNFGTYTGPLALQPANEFKSASSLWTFGDPAVIDFSSIQDGTIDGRIEFTIATGQVDIDLAQVSVNVYKALNSSSLQETVPVAVVHCASISSTGCTDNPGVVGCDGLGPCPCGNFGAPDHGCANSNPNNLGAKLVAKGDAFLSCDTFRFSVTDAAIDKPGLVLSGTVHFSPGLNTVADNAGLLCVGGDTMRGFVVITDATGAADLPDFQAAPYGAAGNVTLGSLMAYQYWFRDPGTACFPNDTPDSDFNFSNAWRVVWQP